MKKLSICVVMYNMINEKSRSEYVNRNENGNHFLRNMGTLNSFHFVLMETTESYVAILSQRDERFTVMFRN